MLINMTASDEFPEIMLWNSGYVADEKGLRIWPFRSHCCLWANLKRLQYVGIYIGSNSFLRLFLHFRDDGRKPIILARRHGVKGMCQVAAIIQLVKRVQPTAVDLSNPAITELLEAAQLEDGDGPMERLTDAQLLNRAKRLLVSLEPKAAAKACAVLLERSTSDDCKVARIKIRAELESFDTAAAMQTLAEITARHPEETE